MRSKRCVRPRPHSHSFAGTENRILRQLLQTHIHAMQCIQDQQNVLMGVIMPLVPVVRSVPPQVDQITAAISDMVANAVSTITDSVENVRSTLVAEMANGNGRTWPSTRVGSSGKLTPGSRRRRSDVLGPQEIRIPVSSPLDSHSHLSLKRSRVEGTTQRAGDVQLPRKLSRLAVPPTDASGPPPLLQTPSTPRRPLADLLVIPGSDNSTSRTQRHVASHTNQTLGGYMRPCRTLRTAGTNAPPTSRSSPALPNLQPPTVTQRRSTELHDMPLATDKPAMRLPSASDQNAISKAIKIEEILVPDSTDVISITSSPLSSPPSSLPPTRHGPHETSTGMQGDIPLFLPSSDRARSNLDTSPPKSMSLRDRRAQISRVSCGSLCRVRAKRSILLLVWARGNTTVYPVGALVG